MNLNMITKHYTPRTEIDSDLNLGDMSLHEVVHYAMHNPGTHYEIAQFISGNYSETRKTALLETAALMGCLDEHLFRLIESDSI